MILSTISSHGTTSYSHFVWPCWGRSLIKPGRLLPEECLLSCLRPCPLQRKAPCSRGIESMSLTSRTVCIVDSARLRKTSLFLQCLLQGYFPVRISQPIRLPSPDCVDLISTAFVTGTFVPSIPQIAHDLDSTGAAVRYVCNHRTMC